MVSTISLFSGSGTSGPNSIAYSSLNDALYVSRYQPNVVSVINLATDSHVNDIDVRLILLLAPLDLLQLHIILVTMSSMSPQIIQTKYL